MVGSFQLDPLSGRLLRLFVVVNSFEIFGTRTFCTGPESNRPSAVVRVLFDNNQLGVLLAEVQLHSVEDYHQDEGKGVEVDSVP